VLLASHDEVPDPAAELAALQQEGIVEIGGHTYGQPRIVLWRDPNGRSVGGRVRIGRYCSISANVEILTGGDHRVDWVSTFPFRVRWGLPGAWEDGHPATKGDVTIGNDVWISRGACILSGVTIGDGAVVGAHAVVARDVAPYAIVVGNPAVEVRRRFDADVVDALLEARWWDLPDDDVGELVPLLCADDVQGLIDRVRGMRRG
jgi:acetyltransferase-like isoleucine patch superfamily enzyme